MSTHEQAVEQLLEEKRAEGRFDVFLCHNSADKSAVRVIARSLRSRGILPWLDEWELPPGQPWQPLLEKQIGQIRSAAVFVGLAGVGPWQEQEIYGFLREFVARRSAVIPVLLDNAPSTPDLPIFLRAMTYVDFRLREPDPMVRLEWGITGVRPDDPLRPEGAAQRPVDEDGAAPRPTPAPRLPAAPAPLAARKDKPRPTRPTKTRPSPADITPAPAHVARPPATPISLPAPGGAWPRVFISYRRSDSSDVTGRLHDRLSAKLGPDNLFTDVDSIPLGVDFQKHVAAILTKIDCMLAVIGRDWVKTTDAAGRRRLDDPADLVRIEIETALARQVTVIPLLVQGAVMPTEAELPPGLRDLAFRNGMTVRPNPDFHRDVDRLEHQLLALAARARPSGD